MKYKVLSLADREIWDEILAGLRIKDDIFLSSGYYLLYATERTVPEAFYYADGADRLFFPYLKSTLSSGEGYDFESAYGYGGPASTTTDQRFLNRAWEAFAQYGAQSGLMAGFCRFNPFLKNHLYVKECRPEFKVSFNCQIVVLTLSGKGQEDIWQDYQQNVRNKIRMAQKNGLSVKETTEIERLKEFRDIYYRSLDRIAATPFYYFRQTYFEEIAKYLTGRYQLLLAQSGDKTVGGALLLYNEHVQHYFLSATTEEGRALGAASLLRHSAVEFGLRRSQQIINFGGGKTAAVDDSLLIFKKGFSNELRNFYIGKFLIDPKQYEDICAQWEQNSDDQKIQEYAHLFLKYRY